MSRMTARWRGARDITLSPECPEWDFSNSEEGCTLVYEGPHATLLANKPAIGQAVQGIPAGFTVERVKVKRHRSGKGTMTVILAYARSAVTDQVTAPEYEIEWVEVQKRLLTHPYFNAGGAAALTAGDRIDIDFWEEEKSPTLKKAMQFKDPDTGDILPLSANASTYAGKILAGVESYVTFQPVLRRTRTTRLSASDSAAGGMSEPPSGFGTLPKRADGGAFEWLKTADRSVKSGKHGRWQRVEEWTGFDRIDEDLYQ